MKAVVIDKNTNIVQNIIIVDTMDDQFAEQNLMLTPIEYLSEEELPPETEDMKLLYSIMKEVNPDFKIHKTEAVERTLIFGVTKWDPETKKYYED